MKKISLKMQEKRRQRELGMTPLKGRKRGHKRNVTGTPWLDGKGKGGGFGKK